MNDEPSVDLLWAAARERLKDSPEELAKVEAYEKKLESYSLEASLLLRIINATKMADGSAKIVRMMDPLVDDEKWVNSERRQWRSLVAEFMEYHQSTIKLQTELIDDTVDLAARLEDPDNAAETLYDLTSEIVDLLEDRTNLINAAAQLTARRDYLRTESPVVAAHVAATGLHIAQARKGQNSLIRIIEGIRDRRNGYVVDLVVHCRPPH